MNELARFTILLLQFRYIVTILLPFEMFNAIVFFGSFDTKARSFHFPTQCQSLIQIEFQTDKTISEGFFHTFEGMLNILYNFFIKMNSTFQKNVVSK